MKVYSGVGLELFAVLTLTLERGKSSASCHCCLNPGERVAGVHWGWGWVGLTGSLDALEKRIIKPWFLFLVNDQRDAQFFSMYLFIF